jgi:hypothetical protein
VPDYRLRSRGGDRAEIAAAKMGLAMTFIVIT